MSAPDRDFDRIATAWLDLMPSEAPDRVIESVLQAVDATPQVRGPLLRGRTQSRPTRLPILAGASLLGAAILAGALLAGGARNDDAVDRAAPSSPPAPSVSAASPSATSLPDPATSDIRGGWAAETGPLTALDAPGPSIRLILSADGRSAWVRTSLDRPVALRSIVDAPGEGTLRFVLDRASTGCRAGDTGIYRVTNPTAMSTVLATDGDACDPRREALERTWYRSLVASTQGGTGLVDTFYPAMRVRLPKASWSPTEFVDAVELGSGDLYLEYLKDPQGFADPCSTTGGARVPIARGLDAFQAYMASLPGYTVEATDLTIGGFPARHLAVTTTPTPACPEGTRIYSWQAAADPGGTGWFLSAGQSDHIYIVDHPSATLLVQVIPQTPEPISVREILDTIRFGDSLAAAAAAD